MVVARAPRLLRSAHRAWANPKYFQHFASPKKVRPALGGELAARDPVWDGEGWDVTGSRNSVTAVEPQRSLALAVATAGRLSPSETQTFGSLCD